MAGNVFGLGEVAIFTTNVDAENETFGYHKTVFGALNPTFWVGAVSGSNSRCR